MLFVFYLIKKGKGYRRLVIMLAFLQICTLFLNSVYTYMQNRNAAYCNAQEYAESVVKIGPVIEMAKSRDDGLYRMENLEKRNNNDSMHFSYAGLTHYSSNEKNFVLGFLEKMGLNYNLLYVEYGNGTTQTVDSLLGVKYLIGSENTINKSYPAVLEENGLTVYQNPYALPLGFLADRQIRYVDMEEVNPFALQNAMYKKAAGSKEDNLKDVEIKEIRIENCTEENQEDVTLYHRKDENNPIRVTYELETLAEGRVYAYLTAQDRLQSAGIYVNGEFLCGYLNRSNWKVLNLGKYRKGEHITFTVQLNEDKLWLENAYFVTEDEEAIARNYGLITENKVNVKKESSSHLKVTTDSDEEELLVLSIPYEENWKIWVDGSKSSGEMVYDTFLAIALEPGKHEIILRYIPKGMIAGIFISLVSIGILSFLLAIGRTRRKEERICEEQGAV